MSIEAMKRALSALEWNLAVIEDSEIMSALGIHNGAINTLREAIALQTLTDIHQEIEQEPVAWRYRMPIEDGHWVWNYATYIDDPKDQRCEPLYTTPPSRKPLTDDELKKVWYDTKSIVGFYTFQEIVRVVEAAHGIKGEA